AYEWRTKIWRSMYVTEVSTDLQKWQQEDALEQWHKKHDPEKMEDQMDVDLPETTEKVNNTDMELDIPAFHVECYNVQNYTDQRNVPVQEIEGGVFIDKDQWTWEEIRKVQARFTQEPRGNQLPYHWKGPNH